MTAGQRLVAELETLPSGPESGEGFALLSRYAENLRRRHPRSFGLSVWDVSGRPLSWAGDVRRTPPQEIPASQIQDHLPGTGSESVHEFWFIISSGGALLMEYRRDSNLAPSTPWSRWRAPWGPLHMFGLLVATTLLILLARRPTGSRFSGLLILSAGTWVLRAWAAFVVRAGAPLDAGDLSSPALYASRSPLDLYRSPLDALLTGVALMVQALILVRLTSGPSSRPVWRRLLLVPGAAGLSGAVVMAIRAGHDSRLDLAGLTGQAFSLAHLAVQIGLLLSLLAPVILLAFAIPRRLPPRQLLRTALLVPPLAGVLFIGLSLAAEQARRDLVTQNLRWVLADQEILREQVLLEGRNALQTDGGLPTRLADALAGNTGDTFAYRLWRDSEMARQGYHSSLEVYAADGRLAGNFAFNMPPPVPGFAGDQQAPTEPEVEHLVFATLSQQQPVLSSQVQFRDREGIFLGSVALYIANDENNVPALSGERDPLPWATAGDETRRLMRGPALVSIYDREGTLRWSAQPDPSPLPPALFARSDLEQGVWKTGRDGSDEVRLFHFASGDAVYALGYVVDPWTRPAARLLRFVLLQLTVLLALAMLTLPLVQPLPKLRQDGAALLGWFLSSWGRKLAAAVLLASLVPLLGLAVLLRAPLERQRQESLNTLGLQSLEVARRVVMDAMVAVGGDTAPGIPSDETLYWLSRVIRQDIDLFMDQRLVATSRRGLFTAGIASPLPDPDAYARIVLEGKKINLPTATDPTRVPAAVSAALDRPGTGAAMLRLPFRRQEEAVARAGAAVSERADLATASLALLLILAAVLVGRTTAGRLHRLTRATSRLARGEEDVLVPMDGHDELARLTASFNTMATALARQRDDLRRRTETMENLVQHAPIGIVHLDGGNLVLMMNPAAQRLVSGNHPITPQVSITDALSGSPYQQGLSPLLKLPEDSQSPMETSDLAPDAGGDRRLRAVVLDLPGGRGDRLLLLEDITESMRSGRLAAWADMARRIAHEIKNPLTPIRLAAEHLQRVHQRQDPDFATTLDKTTTTILHQVEALREIASTFSLYARLPEKQPRLVAADDLLAETLAPYGDTLPPHVRLAVDRPDSLPSLWIDPALIKRALVNLIENSLQAMPDGGILTIRARTDAQLLHLEITDTGGGMDGATLERVFEPYFSTRDAGTGLGLAIARRTVEEHGGQLNARSQPGQGTTFAMVLPIADRDSSTS
jgi:signal transduction histidine kinase/HAMP domain-containing protein